MATPEPVSPLASPPVAAEGPAANANPFRFSTKYLDAETGLYYYGYRYYAPKIQRWTSRDPLGEAGSVNLYAFAGNDPVNRIDPLGLRDEKVTITSTFDDSPVNNLPVVPPVGCPPSPR